MEGWPVFRSIPMSPGILAAISAAMGDCGRNIVEIYHQRLFYDVPAKLAKIDAVVETRGPGVLRRLF